MILKNISTNDSLKQNVYNKDDSWTVNIVIKKMTCTFLHCVFFINENEHNDTKNILVI